MQRARIGSLLVVAVIAAAGCAGGATPLPNSATPVANNTTPVPGSQAASGGGGDLPTGAPVAAGGDLCSVLGPGDFAAAGIPGAGAPTKNNNTPNDAYCVYQGKSSGTGGIEFDIFVDANPTDAAATYDTIGFEGPSTDVTTEIPGATKAGIATTPFASIDVLIGNVSFDIGFPNGPNAHAQLVALAKLVVGRIAKLNPA